MQTLKPDDLLVNSLTALMFDAGNLFHWSRKNYTRTTEYLVKRFRSEGVGFVTKTLPAFGKHFDNALKSGKLSPHPAFRSGKGVYPCFLNGLIQKVFGSSGILLDEPDVRIIRFVRQLCFMFYKLEGEYPKVLEDEKIQQFIKTDENLPDHVDASPSNGAGIIYHAQRVIGRMFRDFDPGDLSPRPGPGQNANAVERWRLYEPAVLYSKVHNVYPYYSYFFMNSKHLLDRARKYRALPKMSESVSKLALVPKDSRGPRVICMEPHEIMWLQQGLGRAMVDRIQKHPLSRGRVNFTDQSINGNLALSSSVSRKYDTLDMKEASDRISYDLVSLLFEDVPKLRDALLSLTTDYILTPHGAIRKKKYAPMGSALCFPVMSVVHFALALGAVRVESNRRIRALAKDLYVYGDDIVCHHAYTSAIMEAFPKFGLEFNPDKCCIDGFFRESCGIDAYKGTNITPVKVKSLTFSKKDGSSIAAALANYHAFKLKGYDNLAMCLRSNISAIMGSLPYVSSDSAALGWIVPKYSLQFVNQDFEKWDTNLQTPSYRVRILTARPRKEDIGDWERLVRANVHAHDQDASLFTRRSNTTMRWKNVPLCSM